MATVFTLHAGKAVVQIAAVEITIDPLLDIGMLPEDRHILEVYASENGVIHHLKAGVAREP